MTSPIRGGIDPRLQAQIESLLGQRPDKDNRAVRWRDVTGALRAALISAGGAGTLDAPAGAVDDGGQAIGGGSGGTLLDRLRADLALAQAAIDQAEADARSAQQNVDNVLAMLETGGEVLRVGQTITLPDGSETAGIEAFVWKNGGVGPGSAVKLNGDLVIAEGTLSATSYMAGSGRNLLQDSRFYDGLTQWQAGDLGGETTFALRPAGVNNAHPDFPTVMLYQNGTRAITPYIHYSPLTDAGGRQNGAPVAPGEWYGVSANISCHRCLARLGLWFFDADGNLLPAAMGPWSDPGVGAYRNPTTWTRMFFKAQAPAGAVSCKPLFMKSATNAGSPDSYLFLFQPMLEKTHAKAIQPAEYASGEIGMWTGDLLYSRTIRARNIAADEAVITGQTQMGAATIGTLQAIDGSMTNAKIGNYIQSDDFVSGPGGRGWRIRKSGDAEFNSVTIRRQIAVASGSVSVGDFVPISNKPSLVRQRTGSGSEGIDGDYEIVFTSGRNVTVANGPGNTITRNFSVPMGSWYQEEKTYLAAATMSGVVFSATASDLGGAQPPTSTSRWGWTASVIPLSATGSNTLSVKLDFWSENIAEVKDCAVYWKIYEVS